MDPEQLPVSDDEPDGLSNFDPTTYVLREQKRTQASVLSSLYDSPEEAVRAQELGKSTGVDASIINSNLENFEQQHKAALTAKLINDNKYLAQYAVSSPMAPKISNDDWGQLDEVSSNYHKFGTLSTAHELVKGFAEGFGSELPGSWMLRQPGGPEFVASYPASAALLALEGSVVELPLRTFSGVIQGLLSGGREFLKQTGMSETQANKMAGDFVGSFEQYLMGTSGVHAPKIHPEVVGKLQAQRLMPYIMRGEEPPVGISPFYDLLKVEEAKMNMKNYDDVMKSVQASATRERDPEGFADNFLQLHTQNSTIGVDPYAIRQLYKDKVPEFEDNLLGRMITEDQLRTAEATGIDLQIPMKDWLAHVDPEVAKQLHDFIRVKPNSLTLEETKAVKEHSEVPGPMASGEPAVDAVRAQASLEPMFDVEGKAQRIKIERTDEMTASVEPAEGVPLHNFVLNNAEGKRLGEMSISEMNNGKNLYVNWLGAEGEVGALGPRAIRDLLAQIQREFPNAEMISGARATGARFGKGVKELPQVHQTVEIPIKKLASLPDADLLRLRELLADVERAYAPAEWSDFGAGVEGIMRPRDQFTQHERGIIAEVERVMDKMVPHGVDLQEVTGLKDREVPGTPVKGMYLQYPTTKPLILYALTADDPLLVARHEGIHHLKQAGFITPQEWGVLAKAAKDEQWMDIYHIEERYKNFKDIDRSGLVEEAIADAYAYWAKDRRPVSGPVAQVFEKIKEFLKQIRDAIKDVIGQDPTFERLFEKIEQGKIGSRMVSEVAQGKKLASVEEPPKAQTYEEARAKYDEDVKAWREEKGQLEDKRIAAGKAMLEAKEKYGFNSPEFKEANAAYDIADKANFAVYTKEPVIPSADDFKPTTAMKQQELPVTGTTRMSERSPFENAAAVGMTKDQYRRYQKLIDQRNAEDVAAQLAKTENRERIRQSKEWKADAAEMRKETEQEVLNRPDIAADLFFRKGTLHGERVPGKIPKLDRAQLTPEQRKSIPPDYQAAAGKNVLSPDDAAGLFGYQSGDALVARLAQLEQFKADAGMKGKPFIDKLIDDVNDRKMEEKYGKLQENAIQDAKDQVASKTQLDIIHEDVLALASKDQKAELPLKREMMEEQLIKQFNSTTIGMIGSESFLRSAGKAGKAAEISLLKGDPAEAFRQKQVQFNAMVAFKQAVKLERERNQFEKLADTYSKRGKPGDLVSGTDQAYTNYIHEILMRLDLPVKRSIQDLIAEQKREGYDSIQDFALSKYGSTFGMNDMPISPILFDPNFKKPYEQLTVDEFRQVRDSMKALSVMGKAERKVTVGNETMEREAALERMKDNVRTFPLKEYTATPTLYQRVTGLPRSFLAASTALETMLNRFDRNDPRGIFNRAVVYPLTTAANYKNVLQREFSKYYQDLGKLKGMDKLVDSPITDPLTITAENPTGSPMKNFTMGNVLVMIHNAGNDHNFNVLAKGYGMEPAMLRQWLYQHSTKEMWDYAQKMGDTVFRPAFEKAQTTYHNIYGVAPEKIDLVPFDTPFGKYKGWYHPLVKDPIRESFINAEGEKVSGQSPKQKGGTVYDSADNFHARTTNGYTKGRTGAVYPLDLNPDMIPIRLSQMLHDIAFRDAIIHVEKIFRDDGLRSEITKHYGAHYTDGLMPYLRGVAGEEGIPSKALGQAKMVSEYLRQNVISAYIGFNIFTALKHGPTALFMSSREVGPVNFVQAMSDLYRKSEDITMRNKDFVDKWSEEVGRRKRHWQDTISGQHADIYGKGTTREWIIEKGSWLVAQSDMASVRPTWLAAYRKAMEENPDHGEAVQLAERAVRRAHGTTAVTNQPALVRGGGPLHSWLTSIYGFFGTVMQRRIELAHAINDTYKLGREVDLKEAAKNVPDVLGRTWAHVVWPIIVEEYVTGLTTEDKHGWGEHLLLGGLHGLGASVLYLRDIMHAWTTGHDPGVGLISSPMHDATKLIADLKKGKKMFSKDQAGKTVQDAITVFGEATGRSPKEIGNLARFGIDMMNKQQKPKTAGDWFRGLTRGDTKLRQVK